jgi:aminoglycoside 6'-N-acetyltransferase
MSAVPSRRGFRIVTDRLVVRRLERVDVTEFTRYRNLEPVARYQDWDLPYTRDLAHELLDQLAATDGPTAGQWVQLALDDGTGLVGDVAVWLDAAAELAMIGYTLAPEHQGKGYAVEAVGAVVDWLFVRRRVHRVAATLDPRNLASARVLERLGFEHDGTARSAALVRGEWLDDTRFSLLRADWRSWRRRPTGPPDRVELVELTHDSLRDVAALEVAFSQRVLVAPVLVSLAEALVPPIEDGLPVRAWYRAIAADDELVGFVMVAEPHTPGGDAMLWRLLVTPRHQGRGIGRRVVLDVAARRRDLGETRLLVSFVPDVVGSPARFYRSLGFVETGRIVDGEVEAALDL